MAETVRELITKLGYKIDNLNEAKKYEDTFKRLKDTAFKFVAAIGAFDIGKKIITSAAHMEDVRTNFEAFTGSAEKANILLEKISKYSLATGMKKDVLEQSAKQMLAMGIGSDRVMSNIEIIGNLAAGLGEDKIPTLTEALTKMNQKGMVDSRAFNALLASGVPILEQLRKQTGMNTRQIMEMGNMGALKFSDMEKALTSLTTGAGKFSNLAIKHGNNLNGIWQRGKNILGEMAEKIGMHVVPSLEGLGRAILRVLGGNMDKASDGIGSFIDKIMFGFGMLFEFLTHSKFARQFGESMKNMFKGLFDVGKSFLTFLDKIHALDGLLIVVQGIAIALEAAAASLSFFTDLISGKDVQEAFQDYSERAWQIVHPGEKLPTEQEKKKINESAYHLPSEQINQNSPLAPMTMNEQISKMVPNSMPNMPGKTIQYNIKSDAHIQVPHGTPLAQQQAITDQVKKLIKEQWHQNLRDINLNVPRTDFSGVKP